MINHKLYPVENKGKKYWMCRFKHPIDGTWKSKYVPVSQTSRGQAELWLATEFFPELESRPAGKVKSVENLFEIWKAAKPDGAVKNEMVSNLQNWTMKHEIGRADLEQLKVAMCCDFVRSIARAPHTRRNIAKCLRNFINDCVDFGFLDEDCVNKMADRRVVRSLGVVEKLVGGESKIRLTAVEVKALLGCGQIRGDRMVRYWIGVGLGLRSGEIAGLRIGDVDLAAATIHVWRQYSRSGKVIKKPKKGSYRTLPVPSRMVPVLAAWIDSGWRDMVGRDPLAEDPLVPDLNGKHIQPSRSQDFRDDLEMAGVDPLFQNMDGEKFNKTFHCLRRTFASLLADAGVEEARISALMGHSRGSITAKSYIDRNLEMMRAEIEKIPLA